MKEGCPASKNVFMDIATALKAARECPDTRQEEFIEKLQLQSSKNSSSFLSPTAKAEGRNAKALIVRKIDLDLLGE